MPQIQVYFQSINVDKVIKNYKKSIFRYESAGLILLDFIERLMAGLGSSQDSLVRGCAKCLAALSEKVEKSRPRILSGDPAFKLIGNLLIHEVEEVRGNGALIASNIVLIAKEEPIHLLDPLLKIVNEVNTKSGLARNRLESFNDYL